MDGIVCYVYMKNLNNDKSSTLKSTDVYVIEQLGREKWSSRPLVVKCVKQFRDSLKSRSVYSLEGKYGVVSGQFMILHALLDIAVSAESLNEQLNAKRIHVCRRLSLSETKIPLAFFTPCDLQKSTVDTDAKGDDVEGNSISGNSSKVGEYSDSEDSLQEATTSVLAQGDISELKGELCTNENGWCGNGTCWCEIWSMQHAVELDTDVGLQPIEKREIYVGLGRRIYKDNLMAVFDERDSLADRCEKVFSMICPDRLDCYSMQRKKNLKLIPEVFVKALEVVLRALPSTQNCNSLSSSQVPEMPLTLPTLVRNRIKAEKQTRKVQHKSLYLEGNFDTRDVPSSESE